MNRIAIIILTTLATLAIGGARAKAHCQIPCGIYNDNLRFTLLEEHIATIEKSMNEIIKLSAEKNVNHNQLARWIANKDKHADNLSEIVTYYFMAQRLLPADESDAAKYKKYVREAIRLHQLLYHAMKAKQTIDLEEVKKLRALLQDFKELYLKADH